MYVSGVGAAVGPETYNGYSLIIDGYGGTKTCYKILGYDYSAPRSWVNTGPTSDDDPWTDHVGDGSHGFWQVANSQRFVLDKNPSGLTWIPGEAPPVRAWFVMKPALAISAHGANGTSETTHSETMVSYYVDRSVHINKFEYYSTDLDMSLEWMITELARKAGVRSLSFEKAISGNVTTTWPGSYGLPAMHTAFHSQRDGSFVLRYKVVSGTETGIAMKGEDGWFDVVTVTNSYVKLNRIDPSGSGVNLIEQMPILQPPTGWITMSYYNDFVCVWINDKLVAGFSGIGSDDVSPISYGLATMNVDLPALDQRVDNFIIEMGSHGGDLLGRLIGQKRIFVKDNQTGGLTAFRTRTRITANTPITMAIQNGNITSDAEVITRVRLEGLEAAEEVDYDALRIYGNLFQLANAEELEMLNQFTAEALAILEDAVLTYAQTSLIGAADPRVEPEDILPVTLPDGTRDIIVSNVSFRMAQDAGQAVFDMEVSARDA